MTRWRVTATFRGKRVCTKQYWLTRQEAQAYADTTARNYGTTNPRVVKDSKRVREMIP